MLGPTLETERLLLRQWRESDLDAFAAMMREETQRWASLVKASNLKFE